MNQLTNCLAGDIATNKVFCILCYLFSSKTQDGHADYFACISVFIKKKSVLGSSCQKEHVLHSMT